MSAKSDFTTTHWSTVLRVGESDSAVAATALSKLCQCYWYPIYLFIRRQGHDPEVAKDLTQEFFALLLQRNDLLCINRQKGKFRSFLIASVKHFLINERRRQRAAKRGGNCLLFRGSSRILNSAI